MKDRTMLSLLALLIILPWLVFFLRTQPDDVLQEVKNFRNDLMQSRTQLEGELLKRTQSRIYYGETKPNIWELIDANELKVPEGWKR